MNITFKNNTLLKKFIALFITLTIIFLTAFSAEQTENLASLLEQNRDCLMQITIL